MHIFGKVEHHGDVTALAGKTRPAPPRKHWRAKLAARGNRGDDVLYISGNDQSNRDLTVVRCVGGVKRPCCLVKADLAFDSLPEPLFKDSAGGEHLMRMRSCMLGCAL